MADIPTRAKNKYFLVESNPQKFPTKTSNSHFLVGQMPRYAPTKRRNSCCLVESFLHQKLISSSFVRNKSRRHSDEPQKPLILVEQMPRYSPTKPSKPQILVEQLPIIRSTKNQVHLTTNNALQPPPTAAYPPAAPASHA